MKTCSFRGHAELKMRQESSLNGDLGPGLSFDVHSHSTLILAFSHCRGSVS